MKEFEVRLVEALNGPRHEYYARAHATVIAFASSRFEATQSGARSAASALLRATSVLAVADRSACGVGATHHLTESVNWEDEYSVLIPASALRDTLSAYSPSYLPVGVDDLALVLDGFVGGLDGRFRGDDEQHLRTVRELLRREIKRIGLSIGNRSMPDELLDNAANYVVSFSLT